MVDLPNIVAAYLLVDWKSLGDPGEEWNKRKTRQTKDAFVFSQTKFKLNSWSTTYITDCLLAISFFENSEHNEHFHTASKLIHGAFTVFFFIVHH